MFEQTELFVCASCNRLLCEGNGPDEVKYHVNDPRVYITFGLNVNAWLCGGCMRAEDEAA